MIEFKPYESKPVTRMAFQITANHGLAKIGEVTWLLAELSTSTDRGKIKFKAYEEPKIGDWVVQLTAEDTYHCTDAVFRERNIVP